MNFFIDIVRILFVLYCIYLLFNKAIFGLSDVVLRIGFIIIGRYCWKFFFKILYILV